MRKLLWILKITFLNLLEIIGNSFPEGSYGDTMRGHLKGFQMKKCGKNLKISKNVRILNINNMSLGNNVYIGYGTWINAEFGVQIGDNTMLGPYNVIASGNHTFDNESLSFYGESEGHEIKIGNGCWLGAGSIITAKARIGDFCLIGAKSIITKKIHNSSKVIGCNTIIKEKEYVS